MEAASAVFNEKQALIDIKALLRDIPSMDRAAIQCSTT
jgi:hypothetical protein